MVESTIAHETIYAGEGPPVDLDGTELPELEYDYRTATATASHAEAVVFAAKSELKLKERRFATVTSAESTPSIVTFFDAGGYTGGKGGNHTGNWPSYNSPTVVVVCPSQEGRRTKRSGPVSIGSDDRFHASCTFMFTRGDRVSAGPGFFNPAESGRHHDGEWRHVWRHDAFG